MGVVLCALGQFNLRVLHTTPIVERMLRGLTVNSLENEQFFKLFPIQSSLTHYSMALQGLTELLSVSRVDRWLQVSVVGRHRNPCVL